MHSVGFVLYDRYFWLAVQKPLTQKNMIFPVLCTICLLAMPTFSRAGAETDCYIAIKAANRATGVPENILLAIAKTETGRTINREVRPWPWAINIRGKGEWLESKAALIERALEQISKGETRFDVGCFQLNYRWHGDAFDSLDEMIAPTSNALYAANFLKSLYKEFEDWNEAVGAYHSRDVERARAYKARFATHYDENANRQFSVVASTKSQNGTRKNSFPLLHASTGRTGLGSLMPNTNN